MKAAAAMKRISPTGNQRGFTLIELLLAVTIGAAVLSAVYMTFTTAIDSQRRIERVAGQTQAQRFFAERLRNDLKSLLAEHDALSGSADSLSLNIILPEQGVREVSYIFKKTAGAGNKTAGAGNKTAGAGQIRRLVSDGEENFDTLVYDAVDKLAFRYLIDGSWRNTPTGESLPQALECIVSVAGGQQQITIAIEVEHVPAPG